MKNCVRLTFLSIVGIPGVAILMSPSACAQNLPAMNTTGRFLQAASAPQSSGATADGQYSQPNADARANAYYNFTMGHLDEELYDVTGRSEYATEAIEFYKRAFADDPDATPISERLAEVYAKSQRIRDAVTEAEAVLKRDPNNLGARRLLARIYIRTLGDMNGAGNQKETIGLAIEQLQAVLGIDPSDTESALWLARLYRFQNQHAKAEEVLRNVLKRDPENEPALEQITQLLLDEGQAQEAIGLLDRAADRSAAPGLFDLLGDAYTQTHNYAKAEQAYRKAVEAEPEEASHRRGLAQALVAEDKLNEALEQYTRLTEIEPDSVENYLRMAQIYRRLNKLDQAESTLLLAKERAPGNLEVLYNEATLYEAQGRYGEAVRVLSDAIAGVKSKRQGEGGANALPILYERLGRVYRDQENYSAAVRTFEDMEKLGPEEAKRARVLLIDTYRAGRDIDRAIAEVKKGIDADPKDQSFQITYAMLLGEKGDPDAGSKILHGLLRGGNNDQEIYLDLAQVNERGRKYDEAEKAAATAEQMARQPSERETAWFLLGAIHERQKKYDLAEQEFRKVLDQNPRNAAALNYYGYMLADRSIRLDEAISLIKRAVAEEPANGAYLDSLGWAYYKENHLAEAEEYLEKAADRSRHDPTILDHLGDVYAKLGRAQQAADLWERAQTEWQHSVPADYEPEKVSQLDQKLKNLKRRLAQKSLGDNKPQ